MSARCCNCEAPCTGNASLPLSDRIEVVHVNDKETQWAGSPCCEACNALYVATCKAAPEPKTCNVDAVLSAFADIRRSEREKLDTARKFIAQLRVDTGMTLDDIGDPGDP